MQEDEIKIGSGDNYAIINRIGGRIEKLVFSGREILGTFTRGDGKQVATHPCSPIFGPETETHYQLPQHGSARQAKFTIEEQSDNHVVLSWFIEDGMYPKGVKLTQRFTLNEQTLEVTTIHDNTTDQPVPVNFAEHCYWTAPNGYKGSILNGQDITTLIESDTAIDLKEDNVISIPQQPKIILKQQGLPLAQLWVMPGDTTYVCIEPCQGKIRSSYFGSEASLINPKSKKQTTFSISL